MTVITGAIMDPITVRTRDQGGRICGDLESAPCFTPWEGGFGPGSALPSTAIDPSPVPPDSGL